MTETEVERMVVRLLGDATSYQKMLKDAQNATKTTAHEMKKSTKDAEVFGKTIDELGTKMSNMAGQFMAMAALQSPFAMLKQSISMAAQFEDMEVNFQVMLKSATLGTNMLHKLADFAANTPMTMTGLTQATKTLLQFGIQGNEILPTLQQLGDVVMGDEQKLMSLALAFGQMSSTGRLMGQDLLQMINVGFNPLQEISRTTGRSITELKSEMEKGAITVEMVKEAFTSATSAGGNFFQGMEQRSKTLNGLLSTMEDDLGAARREIGKTGIEMIGLKDAIKSVSQAAQDFTAWFKEMGPQLKLVTASVVALAPAFLALIVVWKVGAIASGIVVGIMKDMVITFNWIRKGVVAATAATWAWVVAQTAASKVGTAGVITSIGSAFMGVIRWIKAATVALLSWVSISRIAAVAQIALGAAIMGFGALLGGVVKGLGMVKNVLLNLITSTLAWKAALIGGAIYGLIKLKQYIEDELMPSVQELNAALSAGPKPEDRKAAAVKQGKSIIDKYMKEVGDPEDLDEVAKQLEKAKKQIENNVGIDSPQGLTGKRGQLERLEKELLGATGMHWWSDSDKRSTQEVERDIKLVKAELEGWKESAEEVGKLMDENAQALRKGQLPAEIAEINKKLKEEIEYRFKNKEQIAMYKYEQQKAAQLAAQIAKINKDTATTEASKTEAIKKARAEMEKQVDTTLKQTRALVAQKKEQEEGLKALSKIGQKLKDIWADAMKRADLARKIKEDVMTPEEKLAERIADLDDALKKKIITDELHAKAVRKVTDELMKQNEVAKVQQALFGSADAISRVEKYRDAMQENLAKARIGLPKAKNPNAAGEAAFGPLGNAPRGFADVIMGRRAEPQERAQQNAIPMLLTQIRDVLQRKLGNPIVIDPVNADD